MLKFPNNLPTKYYFSLSFYDYVRPDPFSSLMTLQAQIGENGEGNIILPLPAQLVDNQKLNWAQGGSTFGEAVTDLFQGDLAGAAIAGAVAGISNLGNFAGALTQGGGGQTGLSPQAAQGLANGVDATTKSILQKAGLALNPVLTQQFNHPDFKVHQFSWKLSPDSIDESGTLEAIIDLIKYNALPDVEAGGMFFKYPSMALIKMHTGAKELYQFKPCVISDISINYAPSNTPAFFAGTAAPVSVQITITFLEIILNTRKNTKRTTGMSTRTDLSMGQNAEAMATRALQSVNSVIRGA